MPLINVGTKEENTGCSERFLFHLSWSCSRSQCRTFKPAPAKLSRLRNTACVHRFWKLKLNLEVKFLFILFVFWHMCSVCQCAGCAMTGLYRCGTTGRTLSTLHSSCRQVVLDRENNQSWARDNSVATMWPCFQGKKLLLLLLLRSYRYSCRCISGPACKAKIVINKVDFLSLLVTLKSTISWADLK